MVADPFLTPSSAMISPNIIRYLVLVADAHGVSLDRALRAASLSRQLIDSPQLRVSYRQGRTIIEHASERIATKALGLEVGMRQPITSSGLLGLAMMSSATLQDAVRVGMRFQNLAGSMVRWHAAVEGGTRAEPRNRDRVAEPRNHREGGSRGELVVTAVVPEVGSPVGRFLLEEGFANITRMARDGAAGASPKMIELAFDPGDDLSAYTSFFGCPVRGNAGRNAWHMPLALAEAPLPTADPWVVAEATAMLEEQTRSIASRQELVAILAAHIENALPEVLPLSEYARLLALSERTLRRRLEEVGSSYSAVLDDVRKRLAAEFFEAGDRSLTEISFMLGYADERSLRRSALRWFGASPAALRESR